MSGEQLRAADEDERRRAFLARMPLFRAAPPDALARLARQLRGLEVAAGTAVVQQGEPGDDLYLVEDGALEVSLASGGRVVTLAQLGPGDLFGEIALLRRAARGATVTARTPARLWALSRAALAEVIRQAPAVGDHLREVMRQRELANALRALQ
jgi:CRP-like cAMP-binding protein